MLDYKRIFHIKQTGDKYFTLYNLLNCPQHSSKHKGKYMRMGNTIGTAPEILVVMVNVLKF